MNEAQGQVLAFRLARDVSAKGTITGHYDPTTQLWSKPWIPRENGVVASDGSYEEVQTSEWYSHCQLDPFDTDVEGEIQSDVETTVDTESDMDSNWGDWHDYSEGRW